MKEDKLVLGVAPVRRRSLSLQAAARQKEEIMARIRAILPEKVRIVDIDGLCEEGVAVELSHIEPVVQRFRSEGVQALFLPFCDFGEERVAAGIAAAFKLPTLVWGPRDEWPNTDTQPGRDTQCGLIAATKVLRRFGVTYSYIVNCPTTSEAFEDGYLTFLRAANVVRRLRGLRLAQFGNRPPAFMSVCANEAQLVERFGMVTTPIPISAVAKGAAALLEAQDPALQAYVADFTARVDCSAMAPEAVEKVAALKLSIQKLMEENGCAAASMECWSAFSDLLGAVPCMAVGELADAGLPLACEGDLYGAVTLAAMRACALEDGAQFFADLTVRHPQNDNAELLWHCGPFPYSLKAPDSRARMVDMMERWQLKKGDITLCRFDEIDGEYHLFAGEGRAVDGPETTGTYVWFEADDWKAWEEKLVFGPYIHHIVGGYGRYLPALREAARYLGVRFDTPGLQQVHSL